MTHNQEHDELKEQWRAEISRFKRFNRVWSPLMVAALAIPFALAVWSFLQPCIAYAAQPPDLALYQHAICEQETGGYENRDLALGANGELGRCQIKLGTARQIGFQGHWTLLLIGPINEAWSRLIIEQCSKRRARRQLEALGQCYNQGLQSPVGKGHDGFAYAQQVAHRYYALLMKHQAVVRR